MKFFAVAIGVVDIISTLKFLPLVLTEDFNPSISSFSSNPNFECDNKRIIKTTQHNDGINDCGDNSDEFDDPLLISIGCNRNASSSTYNYIMGDFTKSGKVFRTGVSTCEYPHLVMPLESYGRHVYFMCEGERDQIFRMDRDGSHVQNIPLPGKNIQAMAFDQITSNAYIIDGDRIQICDKDFKTCSTLPTGEWPVTSLTFSSREGILFWVEKRQPNSEWHAVKSRRDGTDIKSLWRSRSQIEFITVDESSQKLYCLHLKPKSHIFFTNFAGSSRERSETNSSLAGMEAFAIDNGLVYWTAKSKDDVQACVIAENSSSATVHNSLIGRNIFLYTGEQSIPPEKLREKKTCDGGTVCSHQLCTPLTPDTGYRCFCEDFDKNRVVEPHNGFCEGSTLVVVRNSEDTGHCSNFSSLLSPGGNRKFFGIEFGNGNEFWMLGRKKMAGNESFFALGRKTFESIIDKPISAITYDSVQGCLVLAMTGGEGIYTYRMAQKEPVLFLREEGNEISSLEFDDWGNNIYWITSCDGTIKVVSCSTKKTMVLRQKGSSLFPFNFAIAPTLGVMFVLLLNTKNYSIYSEMLPMSGGRPTTATELLLRSEYSDIDHLFLHYARGDSIFLVTDRVKNFTFMVETKDGNVFTMAPRVMHSDEPRIVPSSQSLVWSNADLQSRAYALVYESHQSNLKIAAVIPAVDSSLSECRPENGGCRHLCFMSMNSKITKLRHKICRCAPSDECAEEDDAKSINSTTDSSSIENYPDEEIHFRTLGLPEISARLESSEEQVASNEFINESTDDVEQLTTSSTEVIKKGEDDDVSKEYQTTKIYQPPAIVNETPVEKTTQNRSYIENRTDVPAPRKKPIHDHFTIFSYVRLFFFITMILFIIIIVLLVTLIIILCYLAKSSRKDRRARRMRESIRMDFLKPFELNYMD